MTTKIYLGNKQIILSVEPITESTNKKNEQIVLNSIEDNDVAIFLKQMESVGTSTGIILFDPEQALNALKKHFTIIQAAGGLIENNQQEILLIFRKGKWDLPKGKLDDGEDLETCATREVAEETGVHAEIMAPLCISYHTYFEKGTHILKESHWYLMKATLNEPLNPQIEEDIEKCEWVKIENLASYLENTHPSIIDVLQKGMEVLILNRKQ